jgi:hypothetical protein
LSRFFGDLDLAHQSIHDVDVSGHAHLGNEQHIQARPVFHDIDDIPVHVLSVQAVDAHHHGLSAPVDVVEGRDDVPARTLLIVRGDGVLAVEEDHIRSGRGGFIEKLWRGTGYGQLGTLQTGCGLLDAGDLLTVPLS